MVPTPDAEPPSLETKEADVCLCPLPRVKDRVWAVQQSLSPGSAKRAAATATLFWDYFITSQSG